MIFRKNGKLLTRHGHLADGCGGWEAGDPCGYMPGVTMPRYIAVTIVDSVQVCPPCTCAPSGTYICEQNIIEPSSGLPGGPCYYATHGSDLYSVETAVVVIFHANGTMNVYVYCYGNIWPVFDGRTSPDRQPLPSAISGFAINHVASPCDCGSGWSGCGGSVSWGPV